MSPVTVLSSTQFEGRRRDADAPGAHVRPFTDFCPEESKQSADRAMPFTNLKYQVKYLNHY
jgi:hypothetical protein